MISHLNEESTTVTYKELSNLPEDSIFAFDSNENITSVRLKTNDKDSVSFRVEMEPNEKFHLSTHNCDETVICYKGKCRNNVTGETIGPKEYMLIPSGTKHQLESLNEKTVIYVEFRKPK